jgi:hypothetical protein
MTTKIISKEEISAHILRVLSGYCFRERKLNNPRICILSPWISDVQLELDKGTFDLDDMWFGLDYGIASINLSFALLLLRLDFGAQIEIVTLPPTQKNYGKRAYYCQGLLTFLDEIGCHIYLNSKLHSKLIISNDSALLGSFNLSKSALYEREEIGVSIDDIGNLRKLENYFENVVHSSEIYGISPIVNFYPWDGHGEKNDRITRGTLFQMVVQFYYNRLQVDSDEYGNFIRDMVGLEGIYSKYIIQEIASDIEGFYTKTLLAYLDPPPNWSLNMDSDDHKLQNFQKLLNYKGKFDVQEITKFVKEKYARPCIPKIKLKLRTMPRTKGEPYWSLDKGFYR